MKKYFVLLVAAFMTIGMAAQGRPHGNHHGNQKPPRGRYIECASPEQINMAMHVLNQQSFDDKKLEIAKLCVTLGRFCVDDLARMAAVFSFDDNRLVFLTYAYAYCEDPQNYYALRDVFSFRSNFDTMMESIQPGYRR